MSLNSMLFIIFVVFAVTVYYLIPGKYQWCWLLAVSYIYYIANSKGLVIFLAAATVSTFYGAQLLSNEEDARKRRLIMLLTLVLNFGILGVLKYTNFFIFNINEITRGNISFVDFALPLGISFYTFQSMGYLLDVYWKRQEPEKNLLKFALFVSFFPQILQGRSRAIRGSRSSYLRRTGQTPRGSSGRSSASSGGSSRKWSSPTMRSTL